MIPRGMQAKAPLKRPTPPSALAKVPPAAQSAGATALAFASLALTVNAFGDARDAAPRVFLPLYPAVPQSEVSAPLAEVIADPSIDLMAPPPVEDIPPDITLGAEDAPGDVIVMDLRPDAAKPKATPLPKAPLPGLVATGPQGRLPIIGPGGVTPFSAYRRPFAATDKPRIAVVIGGLGLNARLTQQAIDELPAEVTLSFMPYAANLQGWIDKARADGHEVVIEAPMEPFDPGADDTGPQTLLAAADPKANIARLENVLGRAVGYIGVMNYQGGKFAASGAAAAPVVEALKARGLAMIGNGVGARTALGQEAARLKLAFAPADRLLDLRRDADAIDDQLLHLEALALQNGDALGAGFAYPITIEQVKYWAEGIATRGYVLAPASAVIERRSGGS